MDPNVSVKLEALTENEMELEITGVEPGRPMVPQDNWDPNVSMGMNYDPTGATGNPGDMTAQGYSKCYFLSLFLDCVSFLEIVLSFAFRNTKYIKLISNNSSFPPITTYFPHLRRKKSGYFLSPKKNFILF
jgi:hypothetical protein